MSRNFSFAYLAAAAGALVLWGTTVAGCSLSGSDDDDSSDDDDAMDDDDDAGDDDDSAGDDDDAMDDDDAAPGECPEGVTSAFARIADWERLYSCGGASMASAPADESVRLGLRFELTEAQQNEAATWVLNFDDEVQGKSDIPGSAELQTGTYLLAYDCNDAIEVEPTIERSWVPTKGSFEIVVTPSDGKGWQGTVRSSGVVFEELNDPASTCVLPDTVWEDLGFGWLPG